MLKTLYLLGFGPRDPAEFRCDMDRMLQGLRMCPPAEGAERVYFAGQKEWEKEDAYARHGIVLLKKTYEHICSVGHDCGVESPLSHT